MRLLDVHRREDRRAVAGAGVRREAAGAVVAGGEAGRRAVDADAAVQDPAVGQLAGAVGLRGGVRTLVLSVLKMWCLTVPSEQVQDVSFFVLNVLVNLIPSFLNRSCMAASFLRLSAVCTSPLPTKPAPLSSTLTEAEAAAGTARVATVAATRMNLRIWVLSFVGRAAVIGGTPTKTPVAKGRYARSRECGELRCWPTGNYGEPRPRSEASRRRRAGGADGSARVSESATIAPPASVRSPARSLTRTAAGASSSVVNGAVIHATELALRAPLR